jgi:RNA polymerase-associated protein RTF1
MMRARVTSTAIRVVCRRRGHRAARVTTNDMAGSEDDVVDHADRDGRANDDDVHDDVHDDDDDDHDDEKSGSSDSDAENGDGYASDLMGDAADRAALAQMNELEREALLLERAEARKEIESRRQIVALAKTRALELARREAVSSTRGISSAKREELEALERVAKAKDRKERAKRVFGGDSDEDEDEAMMDSDSGDEAREVSRAKKAKASSRRRRDVDDDDFSDYEYDEGDESTTPATRAQIDSITLKRHQIEAWVNEPYFESAVTHCLVRVGIGLNKQQENVYRLVEVAGVADGKYKQYSLKTYEYLPGKKTQKWLVLRWGSSEKTFRLSEVSNSPTTSDEWAAWVAHIVDSGSRKITQRDVKVCLENLKEAANYRYTEDDVTRILAEKREKQGSRHKNLLFEKEQVKTKIAQAEAAGDYEALAELEQKKLELQRSITERLNPKGTMEALANINKRNEIKNSEALAKRASEQVARLKRGLTNTGEGDPFSRRPTRLTNYWEGRTE